ncbi:MAG: glucose/galactose MFS transporter [Rikenellaceae bacterium]
MTTSKSGGNIATTLAFIGLMFFSIGFALGINSFLVPVLQSSMKLPAAISYLLIGATFLPFLIFGLPASLCIDKIGYRKTIALSFWIFALAFGGFIVSAYFQNFYLFLLASFISGAANSFLQTAINPYITIVGPIESAAKRMSIMGVCNKLAWPVSPLFFTILVPNATSVVVADLYLPFAIIIAIFVLLSMVSMVAPLPEVKAAGEGDDSADQDAGECEYAKGKSSIWQFPHLVLGALTLFVYVGVETLSLGTAVDYAITLGLENPDLYAWIPSIGMVVGYICGILFIPRILSQEMAMRICAVVGLLGAIALVILPAVNSIWMLFIMSLGCSLMWPALWPLAIADLGRFTKSGSGLLTMAIAGGAVIPTIFGFLKDVTGMQQAYWLAVPCFATIFFYGFMGYKIRTKK